MVQTAHLLENLGNLGLLERLDQETKNAGILESKLLINLVKDKEYKSIPGIGDDFIPDIGLYNAIGSIYPLLNRKQKNEVIQAHLNQFDKLNYMRVNLNHTPYIREPLLLTDIAISRPLYWPGLYDERKLWEGKNSFTNLQKEIITADGLFKLDKVKNDFLVAYALMRKDFTSFGEDYIKSANPQFLDRVIKGIVALRFADRTTTDLEIEKGRTRLFQLLPKKIHDKIEIFRQEADWISKDQFK